MSKEISDIQEITGRFCDLASNNSTDILEYLQGMDLTVSEEDVNNAKIFVIITNMNGYMPDEDPFYTNERESAIEYVLENVRRTFESLDGDGEDENSKFMQCAKEFQEEVDPSISDPMDALVALFGKQIRESEHDSFSVNFGGYNHECVHIPFSQALREAEINPEDIVSTTSTTATMST